MNKYGLFWTCNHEDRGNISKFEISAIFGSYSGTGIMPSYLADHRISLGRSWDLNSRLVPLNASICKKFHQEDLGRGRADNG